METKGNWFGGGVTFGPRKGRVFAKKINKSAARKALSILLSDRVRDNNLILVDSLTVESVKTKIAAAFVTKMIKSGRTLVVHNNNLSTVRSFRNIPNVEVVRAEDVNAADIIKAGTVVASVDALEVITTRLAK
jgi:large subunit ribosomal protein L4